ELYSSVVLCLLFDVVSCVACFFFFFQAEDGIRDDLVTGVQTCALPICIGQALALEVDEGSISVSAVAALAGAALFHPYAALPVEIGRASCRERVEVSGVGGSVRDKQDKNTEKRDYVCTVR